MSERKSSGESFRNERIDHGSDQSFAQTMAQRMAQKVAQKVGNLMAEKLGPDTTQKIVETLNQRVAPRLEQGLNEIRGIARRPRAIGNWLEEKSPWLNRKFLTASSNFIEPFLVGMGLKVEKLGEDLAEVSMPGSWRNQGEGGANHSGALVSLGEFATRLFWEYHLDMQRSDIDTERVEMRVVARPVGDLKAVFRLPVGEREAILHRIRAHGSTSVETQTLIYDHLGRLVAEVEIEWRLRKQLAISAR